jgi:hypothetical protein
MSLAIILTTCCIPTKEEEAYMLVKLFEFEKTKSKSLKKYLSAFSALVILLLGAYCTFAAVFMAVNATKDVHVSSLGALMNKEGSRMLSIVAQGARFQLFNTSEDMPLCVSTINQFTIVAHHHLPFLTSNSNMFLSIL